MIHGPLEADARIAAHNATKIRAALGLVTNWKQTFERYQETHPIATDNKAQDRARARAWIMLNVGLNNDALASAVYKCWADSWLLGQDAGNEWVFRSREAKKAGQADINWNTWKPGDRATALLLKPIGGFEKFLQQNGGGSYFRGYNRETIENLGTALANSIEAGLGAEEAALMIKNYVASASRSLTIAITEQNRAMTAGSIDSYKQNDIEKVQWETSSPCDLCAENQGVVRGIGESFPSDDEAPPAHPHCRCVLLPVVPGMDEGDAIEGANLIDIPDGSAHLGDTPEPVVNEARSIIDQLHADKDKKFVPGEWKQLDREAVRARETQKFMDKFGKYGDKMAEQILNRDKATKSLIDKGIVYQNGKVEAQFYMGGASLPKARIQEILNHLDGLQATNPNGETLTFVIGPSKKGAYGWATLNGEQIWLAPKTAKLDKPNIAEGGSYKMPVLATVEQYKYTMTHEWGHHIDKGGSTFHGQSAETSASIRRIKDQFPDAFKSGYGQTKMEEFFAENFAEYYLTKGKTSNEITQAMAKEFGWVAQQ